MIPQERLVATAEDQIGYMGKRSNSQLDDFKANTSGLWNKYARDLDALGNLFNGKKNGYDWCCVFALWCFVHTFGRELAQKMLNVPNNSLAAGAKYAMNYYKQKGRFFSTPRLGDQIFFGTSSSVWHTGIVVKVQGGYVHTVEGNAGNPSAVRAARYVVGGKNILGYGRPDWSLVPADKPEPDEKPEPEGGDEMTYYKTLDEVPEWYRPTVEKLVEAGALKGTADGVLNVSEDFCRTMTVLDRMGKLD